MQSKIVLFFLLFAMTATAQEFSAGFRAGLNFSTMNGPSEMDDDGNDLEEYELTTGFHVGGMANVKFTDIFSMRAELLYTQKGVDYNYNGPSYWIFETQSSQQQLFATGERSTILSITNSYIDIPISAVGRFGKFEISGGMSAGFLVSSRASGELVFSGVARNGSPVDPFTVALDFNYFQGRADIDDVELRQIGSRIVEIPKSLEAYYELLEGEDRLFNTLDIAVLGGVAFYINQGLFIGVRANYGLSDITKTERDISRLSLDEEDNYIPLDDKDRNLVFQASVGFSF